MAVTTYPVINFDSDNGETAPLASGAGPAIALTGASASTDAGGTVVTLDGSPDLSGVAIDGSHVIYLDDATAGNRRWAAINAKDDVADTVTVEQAFAGTLSGLSWAIGGELDGLDAAAHRLLWRNNGSAGDAVGDWAFEFEAGGGNDYPLSSALQFECVADSTDKRGWVFSGANGKAHIYGGRGTGGTGLGFDPLVQILGSNYLVRFERIKFESSGSQEIQYLVGRGGTGIILTVNECEFYSFLSSKPTSSYNEKAVSWNDSSGHKGLWISNCYFKWFWSAVPTYNGSQPYIGGGISNSYFYECVTCISMSRLHFQSVVNNVFDTCGDSGTSVAPVIVTPHVSFGGRGSYIANNTFHNSASDDIQISPGGAKHGSIINNISYRCGRNFINLTAAAGPSLGTIVDYNLVYLPTSGKFSTNLKDDLNLWGANDPSSADPLFTDAVNGNFELKTNSPAKAAGYPSSSESIGANVMATNTFVDLGAAQRQEPQGGGVPQIIRPSIINIVPG
jgi:hypothetical protein